MPKEKKNLWKTYATLEEDLINCFKKRNIEVKKITVINGATKYIIEVER